MATTQQMKQRIAAFARELAEEFGDALSWLDAIENQAVEIGDAISVELLRQKSADQPASAEGRPAPSAASRAVTKVGGTGS